MCFFCSGCCVHFTGVLGTSALGRCIRYTGVCLTPTYTSVTHSLQGLHICVYAYIYVCVRAYVYGCVRASMIYKCVDVSLLRFSICVWVCIYMHIYLCVHVCVYVCMCICVYVYICVSVYMYAYTCIYTRVWMYMCTRVSAFCLFVLSNLSTACVCITGVF